MTEEAPKIPNSQSSLLRKIAKAKELRKKMIGLEPMTEKEIKDQGLVERSNDEAVEKSNRSQKRKKRGISREPMEVIDKPLEELRKYLDEIKNAIKEGPQTLLALTNILKPYRDIDFRPLDSSLGKHVIQDMIAEIDSLANNPTQKKFDNLSDPLGIGLKDVVEKIDIEYQNRREQLYDEVKREGEKNKAQEPLKSESEKFEGDFLDMPQSDIRDLLIEASKDEYFERIWPDIDNLIYIFDLRVSVATRFKGVINIDPTKLSTREKGVFQLGPAQTQYVKDIINYFTKIPQIDKEEVEVEKKSDEREEKTEKKEEKSRVTPEKISDDTSKEIKSRIQEKKDRIRELENAKRQGNLATFYKHGPDYMKQANDEVVRLEEEIRELERTMRGGDKVKKEEKNTVSPDTLPIIDAEYTDIAPKEPAKESLAEMIARIKNGEKFDNSKYQKQDKKELLDQKITEEKPKEPEAPKPPEPKQKRKLGAIQTDLMEKRSREVAAERMNRNREELRGISGFFKRIWTHNWMAEYYRSKEIKRVRSEMSQSGSTQGPEDANASADARIKAAVLERFLKDTPGLIHELANEWKNDQVSPEQKTEAERAIREAILAYVSNPDINLAEGNLTEAINRAYANVFTNRDGNNSFEPLNIADNIKDYAREMRGQVEHGTAVAELDLDFELTFGKAATGARTEEAYTWRDKIIQKMAESPIGRFVNETTIAAAVCVATAVATRASNWTLRATAGALGGGMVAGGALAAMRESQALKRDRAEHARAMAAGRTFNAENSPRRREINETTYEMVPVRRSIDNLTTIREDIATSTNPLEVESKLRDLIGLLGSIDARINLSDEKKIDLLAYSNPEDIEVERTELDIARAEAKVFAREKYEELGLAAQTGDFNGQLSSAERAQGEVLNESKDSKDRTFEALRKRRRNSAFVKGAVVAGVVGWVFREAIQFGRPEAEQLMSDPNTPSESISTSLTSETSNMIDVDGVPHEVTNIVGGTLKVPEGFHIIEGANDGEYTIMKGGNYNVDGDLIGGKVVAENISFENSELSSESVDALKKAGFSLTGGPTSTTAVSEFTIEETRDLSPQEYVESNKGEFERSHRVGWADNNTVKFDKNELRLSDPVMGKDGQIRISMRGMKPGGSVMGNKHFNIPQLAKSGKVEIWISASQDTQFTPAHIPVGPDGVAVIDPNSAVGKLFKFDSNGNIIERPRFTEAAAIIGENNGVKSGVICATDEGGGLSHVAEKVNVDGVKEVVTTINETELVYVEPVSEPEIEEANSPIVPIPFFVPRTPLERLKHKKTNAQYGENSLKQLEQEMSGGKPFDTDPYFEKIIDGKKIWLDKDGKEVKRDVVRERKHIKEYLDKQDRTYSKNLELFEKQIGPMHEKCRVSVNIPARFEEKNLSNLLDQYVKQVDDKGQEIDKEMFEINIIVNRKEGEVADKSVDAIENWKKKNSGYRVNIVDIIFPEEQANVGMARKYITDLTLRRSVNRPKSDGPLYIESEDADIFSVDKRTVWKLVRDFDREPHVDVLRGVQDRQPEIMQKNDLLFFDRRLWDVMEISLRKIAYRPENIKGNSFVWNRVISGGWNTAYTAEVYSQIGGYVSEVMGEDMKIGQKISLLRGVKNSTTEEITPNTMTAQASGLRASSSPRRFINAMTKKIDPYSDFENQALKKKTDDELLDGIKQYAEAKKEQKVDYERVINTMSSFLKGQIIESQVGTVTKRVLWGMGLKEKDGHYLIGSENKITLTDKGMEKIISLLKDYKDKKKYKLGYRRQNTPIASDVR